MRSAHTPAAPAPLDQAALDQVLRNIADHLAVMNPGTIMSVEALHTEVQVAIWDHHAQCDTPAVGRDINTVLGHIRHLRLAGTRAEFSLRLRLMLAEVNV
jgi:hypothetical protein